MPCKQVPRCIPRKYHVVYHVSTTLYTRLYAQVYALQCPCIHLYWALISNQNSAPPRRRRRRRRRCSRPRPLPLFPSQAKFIFYIREWPLFAQKIFKKYTVYSSLSPALLLPLPKMMLIHFLLPPSDKDGLPAAAQDDAEPLPSATAQYEDCRIHPPSSGIIFGNFHLRCGEDPYSCRRPRFSSSCRVSPPPTAVPKM